MTTQYTITTDAFYTGPYGAGYPAESFSFTRADGQHIVPLHLTDVFPRTEALFLNNPPVPFAGFDLVQADFVGPSLLLKAADDPNFQPGYPSPPIELVSVFVPHVIPQSQLTTVPKAFNTEFLLTFREWQVTGGRDTDYVLHTTHEIFHGAITEKVVSTPEPGTVVLFVTAIAALWLRTRFNRRPFAHPVML